jgi:hypothetical protein
MPNPLAAASRDRIHANDMVRKAFSPMAQKRCGIILQLLRLQKNKKSTIEQGFRAASGGYLLKLRALQSFTAINHINYTEDYQRPLGGAHPSPWRTARDRR